MSGSLRVSLDLTALLAGNTGVALYTDALRAELVGRGDVEVRGFAIGRGERPPVPMRRWPVPLRVVHGAWRRAGWPTGELLGGPADVLHIPDMVPPPTRLPLVLTVHDVLPLTMPGLYGPRYRRTAEQALRELPRVHRVLADCAASAAEIVRVCAVDPARVVVTPLGRRLPTSATPPAAVVPGAYVLFVGSVTPRKGLGTLARAIARLGQAAPRIVVAGPAGYDAEAVFAEIAAAGMTDRVEVLGRVDDATLESLFRHATLLCHPSVAEGFGIPVLEALGYGTPVVAAAIPSVVEVAAGCARLVPPDDVAALADAITAVLDDPAETARLAAAGAVRAAEYSWARTAALTVAAYRGAVTEAAQA